MAMQNRPKPTKIRSQKSKADFSQVGGLANHMKLLREIIIVPLLYGDIYKHFNIKTPKGVIFYGPPGTGKTLVAGALAGEINKESGGKVSFYHRKGADILDKWVGESERKLRELFEKANKTKPSLIFFDELDGLAPERSERNEQIHTSIVATLLSLMDGLDDSSGVIIIGATNRLDSVDSALRRPGRFDRELYFPLPDKEARKEILMVHTKTWKHKPNDDLLNKLADMTTAFCGSDLQALCSEAVLCCLKRQYPMISEQKSKLDLDFETVKVTDEDFFKATNNISPAAHRTGTSKARKMSGFIRPLLQKQLDIIMDHIEVLLPHFIKTHFPFVLGSERYAGRLVLKGNSLQGLNTYIVPALLQKLEHVQNFVLDVPDNFQKLVSAALQNFPSILVIPRVDDWWDLLDNNAQMAILTALDDIHSGLPVLIIATCNGDLPFGLQEHFLYNSSINIEISDPSSEEREQFFAPLFFSRNGASAWQVWHNHMLKNIKVEKGENVFSSSSNRDDSNNAKGRVGRNIFRNCKSLKRCSSRHRDKHPLNLIFKNNGREKPYRAQAVYKNTISNLVSCRKNSKMLPEMKKEPELDDVSTLSSMTISRRNANNDLEDGKIYSLWKRVSLVTSRDLQVVQLELLYDTLLASVHINSGSYSNMLKSLKSVLSSYENNCKHAQ